MLSKRFLYRFSVPAGALAGLLLTLGVTRDSLWIDEAYVAWLLARGDVSSMVDGAVRLGMGEMFMPLYILGMSAWVKAFGDSELALRLANVPFAVLFAGAMSTLSAHLGRRWLWLPLLASPFLFFYMNQARPYIAVISLAAVAAVALVLYAEGRYPARPTVVVCLAAGLLAFGVHLYSAFFLVGLAAFAILEMRHSPDERQRWRRDWLVLLLIFLPFFLLVAAYYVACFLHGASGLRAEPSWKNLAFVFYEFAGLAGLGPPRNALRDDHSLRAFVPYAPLLAPALLVLLLCAAVLWLAPADSNPRTTRRERHLLVAAGLGLGLALGTAYVLKFRMLDRHVAPFFSLLACWALLRLRGLASAPRLSPWAAAPLILLVFAWAVSDVRLVLVPEYGKDDYRTAADFAVRAPGAVFWSADAIAGRYYGIHARDGAPEADPRLALRMQAPWPIRREVIFAHNRSAAEVAAALRQEAARGDVLVILSKPDLHDQGRAWARVLPLFHAEKVAQPSAFEVWRVPRQGT